MPFQSIVRFWNLKETIETSFMFIEAAFALEQGFVFSAMIWAAITVYRDPSQKVRL